MSDPIRIVDVGGGKFHVVTGIGELKAGYDPVTGDFKDFSRISLYGGKDLGIHVGTDSESKFRHGKDASK